MDFLKVLTELGLPGWVVIFAAIVFILKQVGILDYFQSQFSDVREHKQQSENIAIEALREIIRESVQEYSKEMRDVDKSIDNLDKTIYKLKVQIENLNKTVTQLAGIIAEQNR